MEGPRTQYAKSGDLNIAYQVSGDSPIDVVVTPPFATHLELMLEPPWDGATSQRLARFARVLILDKPRQITESARRSRGMAGVSRAPAI